MGFWIFMLVMNMLIPLTMVGFGRLFLKNSPGEINALFGYRTSRSMKNKETWIFAHEYCGALWVRIGSIMIPVTVAAMLFLLGKSTDAVGLWGAAIELVQCIFLIGSIFPVEKALKERFDDDGNLRA